MRSSTPLFLFLLALFAVSVFAEEPPAKEKSDAVRTLDAITIEGAVDVPQVLFITSRDNARFDDGLGWSFLPGAEEILAGVELPTVISAVDFTAQDTEPTETSQSVAEEDPAPPESKE